MSAVPSCPVGLSNACSTWRKLASFFSNYCTMAGPNPSCATSTALDVLLNFGRAKIGPTERARNMFGNFCDFHSNIQNKSMRLLACQKIKVLPN